MKYCFALAVFLTPAFAQTSDRERQLLDRIDQLEKRMSALEQALVAKAPAPNAPTSPPAPEPAASTAAVAPAVADPLGGTTVNLLFDGYYGYNFNSPVGRTNLLRAYDVSSNSFSLNQAALVIENAPDPSKGKRFGARLDLQYGQATQTLQGNPANEPRPDIYRAIFQAYGTYVFPAGNNGLTVDFGKWASSIGLEGNYTKDQINYSRSLWFDYLPFYHMGMRASYKFNSAIAANFWLVNGTQQTEAFNGFKDQLYGLVLTPNKNVTAYINYYFGQENPDVIFYPSGGAPPGSPTIQGVPFQPIPNAPQGHLHIFDSYVTWQASPKFTLAAEADDVISRVTSTSAPARTWGGAAYARYQFTPKFAIGSRAEYLSDRGGLFSGATQAIKETTATVDYSLANGFLMRAEWRRDFSNRPYFYTGTLGDLKREQNTATVGLVWWFGPKQGSW